MYCSNCGTPVTSSLSFCNRCGAGLRERPPSKQTGAIIAFLTAITLLGLGGLGIMVGGALALSKEAGLPEPVVGFFMFFVFVTVLMTEMLLVRNLSRLTGASESKPTLQNAASPPLELRPPAASTLAEPLGSVTDNTTRTLEYAQPNAEPVRRLK
jgi:hypothetical protein